MSRTRLSVITAAILAGTAILIVGLRSHALGDDILSPRGVSSWKITLVATGTFAHEDGPLATVLPPDFRHQHIFDEHFQSKELTTTKGKMKNRREVAWRRADPDRGPQPFWLTYSFRCRAGMRRPTPGMQKLTREIDAEPAAGEELKPTAQIESDHREISSQARELLGEEKLAPIDQLQALYEYVAGLVDEPTLNSRSAVECLRNGGGDTADRGRLLIALCRNRGIPARLVGGLILNESKGSASHWWAEAWINQQWWPMCPTHRHFGPRHFPKKYLVLQVGEGDLVRCRGGQVRSEFAIQDLHDPFADEEGAPVSRARAFWQRLSLYNLQTPDQHLVKFLILLPLASLVVSICRTMIGIPTFGTFSPALLGLMFLGVKLSALPFVLGIFLLTVLIGWGMRRVLDRFHLLQVPRVGVLLTLIVVFLIVVIAVAAHFGFMVAHYITLFPLVILTHLVERFWIVEAEDGTGASLRTLLGTLAVAFLVGLAVMPAEVADTLFVYPELMGLVLAIQVLLGRYTGYRISELFRFRDLLQEARFPAQMP